MADNKPGSIADVMKFMGMKTGEFREDWKALTEEDREQLKSGVGKVDANGNASGTLNY